MTTKTLTAENSRFSLTSKPTLAAQEGDKRQRKFSGVAYSGDVIANHWFWGNVMFELSSITVPDKMPALIDHERSKRAGYLTASAIQSDGIHVEGILLSNEDGQAVARDSDDGFPWQMSVHIDPGRIEEVMPGVKATVNGREVTGPMTVFKDSVLREVSFTATGWDSNTSATAMSRASGGQPQPPTGDASMTPEQIAAMQAENATLKASNATLTQERDNAQAQLTKFSQDRRTADIKTLFSVLKKDYKEDDAEVKTFSAMSQEAFDITSKMLTAQAGAKPTAPAAPAALFGHTATDGATQPAAPANPLLADAQKRATQFAK